MKSMHHGLFVALLGLLALTNGRAQSTWSVVHEHTHLNRVVYVGEGSTAQFVAVGEGGIIARSTDGQDETQFGYESDATEHHLRQR